MHLVNSICRNGLAKAHIYFNRASIYVKTLENIMIYMGLYPNKNEYIDFAISNEFKQPITQLISLTESNYDN